MHETLMKIYELNEALRLGIVPLGDNIDRDVNRILAKVPPEEARKLRRRFRKLWRREARQVAKHGRITSRQMPVGFGEKHPNRSMKEARKRMVFSSIKYEIIKKHGEPTSSVGIW